MDKLPEPTQAVALEGVAIQLNGCTYILPPCSLATLKRHAKGIDAFSKMGNSFDLSETAVDTILAVIFEALRRNYPDITAEFVSEHLGVDIIMKTFQAAMDASGLIRKSQQTSTAAQGGGTLGESTGIASPPTL